MLLFLIDYGSLVELPFCLPNCAKQSKGSLKTV